MIMNRVADLPRPFDPDTDLEALQILRDLDESEVNHSISCFWKADVNRATISTAGMTR
jgi:hypothetical protein